MKKSALLSLVLVGSLWLLSGCGSSQNTSSSLSSGSCSSGYVYTSQYGCQLQGSSACSTGYVSTATYGCVLSSTTTTSTSCSSGYVYTTQYGCQIQGTTTCSSGYVSTSTYGCVLGSSTSTSVSTYQGSCQAGYIQTAYGCLPQSAACTNSFTYGYAYGYYNGMCFKSIYL